MSFVKIGNLVMTKGVSDQTEDAQFRQFARDCLTRYLSCDWGEMDKEGLKANDYAAKNGERILASYRIPKALRNGLSETKLWIITKGDRSATTLLFPSEY